MKVGRDIFFSLPYTLKFIFNELDIQCKGQKEMLVKINIKDVFLGGYVEQTRKHYEVNASIQKVQKGDFRIHFNREPSYSREIAYKWAWVAEMLIQILDKITLWNMQPKFN
ncbi:hypothetical protein NC653_003066 [Populus alba x Populus x berolinensis]|uniref:Uncharacterized protein n=1 Tax=Populus alba x Populus x berolinensis TaxID=444605 RepID=A0AAD6WHQ6_9ROSI|nr:hypothetical protein NC653_003066 [Populus alba x Populus x berolinensis]